MFSYSGQISNLQVKTYDENIPGHPHNEPGCVLQRQKEESERQIRLVRPPIVGDLKKHVYVLHLDQVK